MIDCPDSTLLRTHLDHPDAALEDHLDDCEACTGLLHAVAETAGFARRELSLLEPTAALGPVDVEAALAAALASSAAATPGAPVPRPARRDRTAGPGVRRLLAAVASVLVVVAVAGTPSGRSAVGSMLDAFRGERLQVVTVDLEAWATAPVYEGVRALEALGAVDLDGLEEPIRVADLAEAERVAGIVAPTLPGPPDRVAAMAPGTVRIVLDRDEASDVPADLDGAALVVDVPGVIVALFGPDDGPPDLVVGRSGPLVVRAEGAPLEDVRAFLLGRDELPADLRTQLAGIDDWRSTVPVPVPTGGPGWRQVEVGGREAIAFGDDSGVAALVLRHDPDGVTVVGGRTTVARALELAAAA
jgi:hypothetical protein